MYNIEVYCHIFASLERSLSGEKHDMKLLVSRIKEPETFTFENLFKLDVISWSHYKVRVNFETKKRTKIDYSFIKKFICNDGILPEKFVEIIFLNINLDSEILCFNIFSEIREKTCNLCIICLI